MREICKLIFSKWRSLLKKGSQPMKIGTFTPLTQGVLWPISSHGIVSIRRSPANNAPKKAAPIMNNACVEVTTPIEG